MALFSAYRTHRDPFHPAVVLLPMCAFIYVLMPLYLARDGTLFAFINEGQAIWVQIIVILGLLCLIAGLFLGSRQVLSGMNTEASVQHTSDALRTGGYVLGSIGVLAWLYTIKSGGGFLDVFGTANGRGWSEFGYIRETCYLMIVGLLLLFSPEAYSPKNKIWMIAVTVFSVPYLIQGLLGAQRGPTFLIMATLGLSWYMARGKRPSLISMAVAGVLLGCLLVFLVVNRGSIYIGSQDDLKTDASSFFAGTEANEYIFGAGCMIASNQTGDYFWGKRYLAQVVVRPVPRQLWPTKYADFGVPELEQNAGVAKTGLAPVMGWSEVTGAAAALVGDLWVEFSWLALPTLGLIGYGYARAWRKARDIRGPWITQYTILILLSIYMVSQSGEAVIFRLIILSLPSWWVWQKARYAASSEQVAHSRGLESAAPSRT